MEATRKRQRANTGGDAIPPHTGPQNPGPSHVYARDLVQEIETLHAADNGAFLKQLVAQLATQEPYVSDILMKAYDDLIRQARARVINFDHYSSNVWHSINKTYKSMSGSKQYEIAFQVVDNVVSAINSIGEQAGVLQASFGTKSSGLQTLRKIGKTICLSGSDTLGHEVQKNFQHETALEDAMCNIVAFMTSEERSRLCLDDDGRSTFLDKMYELENLARNYCVFEGLTEVIRDLRSLSEKEQGDEDDHDESDEDDEHGEQDLEALEEDTQEEYDDHDDEGSARAQYEASGRLTLRSDSEEMDFLEAFDSDGAPIGHKIRAFKRKYGRKV